MAGIFGNETGFGSMPTVRKPKPQPTQIDTNGRQTGASFTTPTQGEGGTTSTGFPGGGRVLTTTAGSGPGSVPGGGKPATTALGTTPAAKGATPAGIAASAPPPPPSGAPDPGTPNTGAIPPIQSDEDAITDANTDYTNTYGGLYQGIQDAASAYGDPTVMGQYGVGAVNPNSALALAAVKALQANQANDATQTNNGTFFSSVNQTARGNIGDQQQRDDLAAQQAWQDALSKFNSAVTTAQDTRARITRNAREDEATQAAGHLPTTAAPVAGPVASTGGGGQQAKPSTSGSGFSGLKAAAPPVGFSGYGGPPKPAAAPSLKINVPKVKSGFGYRGGF